MMAFALLFEYTSLLSHTAQTSSTIYTLPSQKKDVGKARHLSLPALPTTSMFRALACSYAWLLSRFHALLCEQLPYRVEVTTSARVRRVYQHRWWLPRYAVKLWLPWTIEDPDDTVHIWYKARCRSFCYVTTGARVLSCSWEGWPAATGTKPDFANRIIVARIVSEGHSSEVTATLQAMQGPLYDFHGLLRPAAFWLPSMCPDGTNRLYIITAGGRTFKLGRDELLSLAVEPKQL